MYQLVNFYERGVIKSKRLLVELIETSDEPLTVDINWGGVVALPPPFHRILLDSVCLSSVDLWE